MIGMLICVDFQIVNHGQDALPSIVPFTQYKVNKCVNHMCTTPDAMLLAAACSDSKTYLFRFVIDRYEQCQVFGNGSYGCALSKNGTWLVTIDCYRCKIIIYHVPTMAVHWVMPATYESYYVPKFSPIDEDLLVYASYTHFVWYKVCSKQQFMIERDVYGSDYPCTFAEDGKHVYFASSEGICVWKAPPQEAMRLQRRAFCDCFINLD